MGFMEKEGLGQKEELQQRPGSHQVSLPEGPELQGTTQPREFICRYEWLGLCSLLLPVQEVLNLGSQVFRMQLCTPKGEMRAAESHGAQKVLLPEALSEHLSLFFYLWVVESSYDPDLKYHIGVTLKQARRTLTDISFKIGQNEVAVSLQEMLPQRDQISKPLNIMFRV